ncbi:MAG: hypothetical protein JRC68_02085 [Deltaproteobacteria bacterium]|nr:hypothetical protein [Deltaproteobacteria bacterium]
MLGPEEPFFELKDYTGIQGRPIKTGMDQFAKGMIADKEAIITCIQAGCDNYIAKPFDIDIIVNKLKAMGFVDS